METSTLIVHTIASSTGQIITDSIPVLYYMFGLFVVGLVLVFFMRAIKGALHNIFR